jgi:hypothetical protein
MICYFQYHAISRTFNALLELLGGVKALHTVQNLYFCNFNSLISPDGGGRNDLYYDGSLKGRSYQGCSAAQLLYIQASVIQYMRP